LSSLSHKIACWEALNGDHYIFITAHFNDSDWLLNKKIIGFKIFSYPHNTPNISKVIMHVAREYRIDCKSFTIDNTSKDAT